MLVGAQMMLGGKTLNVFQSNTDDPYITVPDEDDKSDDEDAAIKSDDFVFTVGSTAEEQSIMEVYVYDEKQGSTFVHHDFHLPAFPLCTAWMDLRPNSAEAIKGSFLAVGTFQPGIEIWNLDVMDVLEPVATLGGRHPPVQPPPESQKSKKKKSKSPAQMKDELLGELKQGSHSDAVMCLSWSPGHRTRLASGSADCAVKLWDLSTASCSQTLTHHRGKVQSLQWNPSEPSVLLTGAYDHKVAMCDVRAPNNVFMFPVGSDVESLCWSIAHPFQFLVSVEAGSVICFDARRPNDRALFQIAAHERAATAIGVTHVNGVSVLATVGLDAKAKLWDITSTPRLIESKDLNVGPLFAMGVREDVLAAGGQDGKVAVWHFSVGDAQAVIFFLLFNKIVRHIL
jgi:periodic tryptophan protein 1